MPLMGIVRAKEGCLSVIKFIRLPGPQIINIYIETLIKYIMYIYVIFYFAQLFPPEMIF